jgi:hypothetical protein
MCNPICWILRQHVSDLASGFREQCRKSLALVPGSDLASADRVESLRHPGGKDSGKVPS